MSNQPPEIELIAGSRQSNETDVSVTACNDWLRMGSGRSLAGLIHYYQQSSTFQRGFKPPTTSYATLRTWSSNYDWSVRASEYDASWEDRKNAEREAVLSYGLALDYERLRALYTLEAFLRGQLYERSKKGIYYNVWLPDVKGIRDGDESKLVDIERFNAPLIEQYRKTLEDIAKEVGGRVSKTDVTSGGKEINTFGVLAIDYRASLTALAPIEAGSVPDSDPSSDD
jgi:hypothetical protein